MAPRGPITSALHGTRGRLYAKPEFDLKFGLSASPFRARHKFAAATPHMDFAQDLGQVADMKITLDQPFTVGDLAPDVSYPHIYITTFFVNGPAQLANITYEVGTLSRVTELLPMGQWTGAPEVPGFTLQLRGDQLFPFFGTQVQTGDGTDPYLWDQVEALLYQLIQRDNPRMSGVIG